MADYLSITSGRARLSEWCNEHALPHLATWSVYRLDVDGPHELGTMEVCDE